MIDPLDAIRQLTAQKPAESDPLESIRQITSQPTSEQKPEFNWPRFLAEGAAKGVLSAADFGELIGNLPYYIMGKKTPEPISERTQKALEKAYGVDIASMGGGETAPQRIAHKAAEFAGSVLTPGGGIKAIAKSIPMAAGLGTVAGGLREAGIPEPVADITAGLGVPAGWALAKKAGRLLPSASSAKNQAAEFLQGKMTPKELSIAEKNLRSEILPGSLNPEDVYVRSRSEIPGYYPTSAQVAESPQLALLQESLGTKPESGIPLLKGQQEEAIKSATGKHSALAAEPEHIKEYAREEFGKRLKHQATHAKPHYEATEAVKDVEFTAPELMESLQKVRSGKLESDINSTVRKITGKESITPKIMKGWERFHEKASPEAKKSLLNKIAASKPLTVEKGIAIDQSITSKIEDLRSLTRKKSSSRIRNLTDVQEKIRKPLFEAAPDYEQAVKKYAESSKPVNEFEKSVLGKLTKSQKNKVMPDFFGPKSEQNAIDLKNILGKDPVKWKTVQDHTLQYVAEKGKTPHKLEGFLSQHKKALDTILGKEQMDFVNQLDQIYKSRQKYQQILPGGSLTQPRESTANMVKESLGLKTLNIIAPKSIRGPIKKGTSILLGRWFEGRENKLMPLIYESLRDPKVMHELLTHDFKGPSEFNKFMQRATKYGAPTAAHHLREED